MRNRQTAVGCVCPFLACSSKAAAFCRNAVARDTLLSYRIGSVRNGAITPRIRSIRDWGDEAARWGGDDGGAVSA